MKRRKHLSVVIAVLMMISMLLPQSVVFAGETAEGQDTGSSWYDDSKTNFSLKTETDMQEFARLVNEGKSFKDKTVELANDITLTGEWTPVGTAANAFEGTFNGRGRTISGLSVTDATGGYKGLFGYNKGTVRNFILNGSIGSAGAYITAGSDNIGGAVGYNDGTVERVTGNVSVFVKTGSIYAVGGVVGQNGQTGLVSECVNKADVEGTKHTGGVVGRNYGKIDGCANYGSVKGNGGSKDGIGGILGLAGDKNSTYKNSVTNCYNTGTISNNNGRWHGGIVGMADSAVTVTNCYNTGTIVKGYSWNWNPIIGHVDHSYENVHDNYSLEGLAAGDTQESTKQNTIGIVKSASDFKSDDMITLLGSSFAKDTTGMNDGYPVLNWQLTSAGDKAAADDVIALIALIPEDITRSDSDIYSVLHARAAYDNLSADVRELVPDADRDKLDDAVEKLSKLIHSSGDVTAEGLDDYTGIIAEPVTKGTDFDTMASHEKDMDLIGMYNIRFVRYSVDGGELIKDDNISFDTPVKLTVVNERFEAYSTLSGVYQTRNGESGVVFGKLELTQDGRTLSFSVSESGSAGLFAEKESTDPSDNGSGTKGGKDTDAGKSAKTGDDFSAVPLVVIMLLAAGTGIGVFIRRRRSI